MGLPERCSSQTTGPGNVKGKVTWGGRGEGLPVRADSSGVDISHGPHDPRPTHFSSKRALFVACVEAAIARNRERLAAAPAGALGGDLEAVALSGLEELAQQRQVVRMLFHDGDRFPELGDRFFREVTEPYFTPSPRICGGGDIEMPAPWRSSCSDQFSASSS